MHEGEPSKTLAEAANRLEIEPIEQLRLSDEERRQLTAAEAGLSHQGRQLYEQFLHYEVPTTHGTHGVNFGASEVVQL